MQNSQAVGLYLPLHGAEIYWQIHFLNFFSVFADIQLQ